MVAGDDPDGERAAEPANLRFLRRLVTVLTAVMILGIATIILLLAIRINALGAAPPLPRLPEAIALPDGVTPEAITFGDVWIAVVAGGDRILIYDRRSGDLVQTVAIDVDGP